MSIKVGDLVQIVRHPCCGSLLGSVFCVGRVFHHQAGVNCTACNTITRESTVVENAAPEADRPCNIPLSWLKRIPPLSELDDVKRDEEITA